MRLGIVGGILAMWVAAPALADTMVISNGLAPPNPANVLDDGIPNDSVEVHNLGCGPAVYDQIPPVPCPMPWGDPTSVELVDGGTVGNLRVFESSDVTMSGGSAVGIVAYDSSTVTLSGASAPPLFLVAFSSSTFQVLGTNFTIDSVPVGSGPIAQTQGWLIGTLESGEPINTSFCHDGCTEFGLGLVPLGVSASGLITLVVPEPDAALLFPVAALGLAALRAVRGGAR